MKEKYIELIINKCIDLKRSKVVFISYNKEIKPFIELFCNKLKNMNIEDIYLDEVDEYYKHDLLKKLSTEEIKKEKYFDCSIWDEYAKKNANFIMFETEMPNLYDDIETEKIKEVMNIRINTKPLYRKLQEECKLLWTIVAYPGELWAKDIFDEENSYKLLEESIYKMCMLDKKDPLKEWDNFVENQIKKVQILNNLNIEKLHYENSLGTDLYVYLPDKYKYESALDNGIMVNMPSYEIFTSPIYNKTEGIVYSTKPLIYNGGVIDEFYLKFKNGKVVSYDAKKGKELLKIILEMDEYSSYLGEAALVEYDSPISKMNINFKTTLIDENASCHLALGAGFRECIEDGINSNDLELKEKGINISKAHVDFMIGNKDLKITAYTHEGEIIPIFENGNFSKNTFYI